MLKLTRSILVYDKPSEYTGSFICRNGVSLMR